MTKTILGIWAHPDDETFVSGGLMADAARRGERVVCIHMTRGEAGLSYRRPCSPTTLARVRRRELDASLARLGVEEQRFLDFPDGCLARIPSEEGIACIYDELVEVQPDVIVTFRPDGFTGHPDHKSLSAWVTGAFEPWNKPAARLYHAAVSAEWKDSFVAPLNEFDFFWPGHPIASMHPDVTLTLDDELAAAKVDALRAHASQMKPLFHSYGDDFMRAMASVEHFRLSDRLVHSDPEVSTVPDGPAVADSWGLPFRCW
jgi:LmbE family N-acetylglucosaminyl deacetylase